MALYGIYGEHTVDNCPLTNRESRKVMLDLDIKNASIKFIGMYHSALEHTFLWVVEADNAHTIQKFLIDSKVARFNSAKIVPLGTFDNLLNTLRSIET
ncbi:MAG: hypothetical protein D6752_03790 [Candidatus Nitrosothermus koennekii]|nr:MAG: hypothetical protein D6752_03790 [Candidatus Nitrosothermus koennekii]